MCRFQARDSFQLLSLTNGSLFLRAAMYCILFVAVSLLLRDLQWRPKASIQFYHTLVVARWLVRKQSGRRSSHRSDRKPSMRQTRRLVVLKSYNIIYELVTIDTFCIICESRWLNHL